MIIGELTQKRTPNSKTYLNLDGSYEAHIFQRDVHFEDESGNLHNIEVKLFDEADFDLIEDAVSKEKVTDFNVRKEKVREKKNKNSLNHDLLDYHSLKTPFDCIVPRNFKRGYSIGKGTDKLTFKPVGASPAKGHLCIGKDNAIEYQDPWNDVDVCLELTDIGIKETIIVKTNLAPSKFVFEVEGSLADDLTAGILKIEPAWLKDAAGTKRDVDQLIRRENDKIFLDIVADVSGLVFPIEIDPTVTSSSSKDTYTSDQVPDGSYSTEVYTRVGWTNTSDFGWKGYGYLYFPLAGLIPAGASIISANLKLYLTQNFGNGVLDVRVNRVTSVWTEGQPTYNSPPATVNDGNTNRQFNGTESANQYHLFDVKQSIIQISNSGATYEGFQWAPLSCTGSRELRASSREAGSNPPVLEITYNQPPTAPTVTAPNGGETWNAQHTVTWNPSTDVDTAQASLQYQIQLTTDNGGAWNDIIALTQAGITSVNYDFSSKPESSLCKIRIRAFDGVSYGPWDESNGVFTLQHNQAPLAPINLSPSGSGYDRAQIIRFNWQHVDPNSSDPQSKFDLQWRLVGYGTWNTITQTTTNQYYDMPANTLPAGNIEWQVRTYDQQNLAGPYSSQSTFTTGDQPASPTITYPTSGAVIPIARPNITWSSSGQAGYQLQILDSLSAVVYDSGDVTSGNKAQTIGFDLANGSSYTVKLKIKNSVGIWSNWVSSSVTVSYTPPAIPLLIVTSQNGFINIAIDNPTPSGSEPAVSSNDLYRRELGESTWTRIKSGIASDGSYRDYAVASGVAYEYKVIANGSNGTVSESIVAQGSITLTWLWLHDVTDPQGTILQVPCSINKSENTKYDHKLRQFAGRTEPSVVFGTAKETDLKVKLDLTLSQDWWDKLKALADRRGTICARDFRGRKIFGFIPGLSETDKSYGQEVDLEVIAIGYFESV